jgi:FMN-dependent NADH-azoreductase
MTLLHVSASMRPEGSVSRNLATTFLRSWLADHPDETVVHRDLGTDPLPHLDLVEFSAALVPTEDRTDEQVRAVALQREIIDEFVAADAYLIATPLYNYSIPSTVKAWIDRLLLDQGVWRTAKPAAGRPATVLMAKGGGYGPGSPREGWDHAEPYLRRILADVLGLDTTFISAEHTLAAAHPETDLRDDSARRAHDCATAQAHRIAEAPAA